MAKTVHPASRIMVHDLDLAPVAVAEPAPGVIGLGRLVTLHFALHLENGEVIDSNFDKLPVTFTIGDGSLLPGFEQALSGLGAGATRAITLEPEQAFGPINEDNVQRFPLYQFPPDLGLAIGVMIEFADAAGNNQAGVVRSVDKQWVEVDFNHPLAGRRIRFSVHVHKVAEAEQV
jgi:FKBP-type peptidyl-prolyl cis-trans isomerase SlpA